MNFVQNEKERTIYTTPTCEKYFVNKIDSINEYYIVYAKKDSVNYKIVSKKTKLDTTSKIIKEKNFYCLQLTPLMKRDSLFGYPLSGSYHNKVSERCIVFDNNTTICNEKGVYDLLYKAENLLGLYVITKNEQKKSSCSPAVRHL